MHYLQSYIENKNSPQKNNKLLLFNQQGIRLRKMRENRYITQEELGEILGYTQQSIALKEQGKRPISIYEFCRFSKALNLTVPEILYVLGINE